MPDKITVEILADGTIKTSTDKISMANHGNAESFIREMFRLAGGSITRKLKHAIAHLHGHDHEHEHTHQ